MVKIKICGNINVQDALEAARLGADFVGCVVEVNVATPRKISAEKAKEIISSLPASAKGVAVIMPETLEEALQLYEKIKPFALQLQGDESLELVKQLKQLPCKIIKTVHVRDESSIEEAKKFSKHCDAILLDTPSVIKGGSGKTHNWSISRKIVESVEKPVFLAGGLTPENVEEAIKTVKPYVVDVSSGVELQPGKKDYKKVKKFIENARESHPG